MSACPRQGVSVVASGAGAAASLLAGGVRMSKIRVVRMSEAGSVRRCCWCWCCCVVAGRECPHVQNRVSPHVRGRECPSLLLVLLLLRRCWQCDRGIAALVLSDGLSVKKKRRANSRTPSLVRRFSKLPHALSEFLGQQTRRHIQVHPIEHDGLGGLRVG